jgi:hypothetical protein
MRGRALIPLTHREFYTIEKIQVVPTEVPLARPVSWLARVRELHRSVVNSVRSHYERRDLEALFRLQPRSANKVIQMMPRTAVGASLMVKREDLAAFLERVRDTPEPAIPELFKVLAAENPLVSREKMRSLERRDLDPLPLTSLPDGVHLGLERLEITFRTVEELVQQLYTLARVLDSEPDAVRRRCERSKLKLDTDDEMKALFAELQQLRVDREREFAEAREAQGAEILAEYESLRSGIVLDSAAEADPEPLPGALHQP